MAQGSLLAVIDDRDAARGDALRGQAVIAGLAVDVVSPHDAADALARLPATAVTVVGVGSAGDAALQAAAADDRVTALALIDAPLSAETVALIADWPQVAVLAVAARADRPALAGAVDAYLASSHPCSKLVVGPSDVEPAARVADWLAQRLAGRVRVDEIVLDTPQGWRLHGTRRIPSADHPVPGVILLHTGRSDRAAFSRLERLLAERGFAVLNFDWRGRGQSINQGTYFDLPAEVRAAAWEDALAALEHLAQQPQVDPDRLAAVGVVHGAEYAVRAAVRDERVKALVLLTGYRPADDSEAAHLVSGKVEVLYVTSTDHSVTTDAMRSLYEASPGRRTRYVEYPGGAIGYQLFEVDEELEPDVVDWLAEVLTP